MSKVTDEAEVLLLSTLPNDQRKAFEHYFSVKLLERNFMLALIILNTIITAFLSVVLYLAK